MIEGFHRTIKEKCLSISLLTIQENLLMHLLVDHDNNAIHSSIKITPKEASRKEDENKLRRN